MAYNKDLDYTALIRQASAAGDLSMAAALEASRNEKIEREGMNYAKTNDYSNYQGKQTYNPVGLTTEGGTDWSTTIKNMISNGASSIDVGSALQSRVNKAMSTPGLSQYAYDDVYKQAQSYIAKNKQEDTYESLLDKLVNREPFQYNPQSDPSYQAYATQYEQNGNRAMQDALGELAGMTGGMPSSAAIAAANQAKNKYMSEMGAVIPQFEQVAYGRRQDDIANDAMALGLVRADIQQGKSDAQNAEALQFARAQDLLSMGFANPDIARSLGITPEQAGGFANLVNQGKQLAVQNSQATLTKKLTSGSGGGGRKSGGSSKGNGGAKGSSASSKSQDYEGLFAAAKASRNPQNFISSNYKRYGFKSVAGLWAQYKGEDETNTEMSKGLMTRSEWARHKNSGNDSSGASNYETYEAYVDDYKKYLASL